MADQSDSKRTEISEESTNAARIELIVEGHSESTKPALPVNKRRDPLIGTVVAERYELVSLLGRGATTTVYKAEDKEKKRFVAVKLLRTDSIFNEQLIRRFEQECKTLALLKHSNIVQLYDHGVNETDQPYLVMEFVDGTSLKDLIEADNRIDIKRTLKFFIQICAALAAAHDRGVVHRDMKPANVMITKDANGEELVKLLDFGVAKILVQGETFQTKTQTGEMLGTLLYMSPEQCLEQVLDERCDVYSVGCVLYETLTGTPPLIGRTAFETMNKHLTEMPEKLAKVRPDRNFDARLDAVIQIAMAKDPNNRYQTVREMQSALLAILGDIEDESTEAAHSSSPSIALTVPTPESSPTAVVAPEITAETSSKLYRNVGLTLVLFLSLFAGTFDSIWFALSLLLLFVLFVSVAEPFKLQPTVVVSTYPRDKAVPSQVVSDDSSRAGSVYFLAMEAIDGVAWKHIYAEQIAQYAIQESEVTKQKIRLIAAQHDAWMEVKNFTLYSFDKLDKDKDGFLSRAELLDAKISTSSHSREHELLSFLIKNMDDIQSIVHNGGFSDKGVRRQDLSEYFLHLENVEKNSARA